MKINCNFLQSKTRFSRRDDSKTSNLEASLETHGKIKKFLNAFLDHCFKDLDYVVKERQIIEKLCDIEIRSNNESSTFYTGKLKYWELYRFLILSNFF